MEEINLENTLKTRNLGDYEKLGPQQTAYEIRREKNENAST